MLINEMAEALGFGEKEKQMADRSVYGEVISINDDGSFQVSLNGSDTTTTCAKMTGAKVGDTVLVTILSNGYAVVTGCVGGDTDASDAREIAEAAQALIPETVDQIIASKGLITADEQFIKDATAFTAIGDQWIATKYLVADNIVANAILTNRLTAKNLNIEGGSIVVRSALETDKYLSLGVNAPDPSGEEPTTETFFIRNDELCIKDYTGMQYKESKLRGDSLSLILGGTEVTLQVTETNDGGGISLSGANRLYTNRIIPNIDATYSIGATTERFINLYLSGHVLNSAGQHIYADKDHTHSEYAPKTHYHSQYYSSGDSPSFGTITATRINATVGTSSNPQIVYLNPVSASVDPVYRATTSGALGTSSSLREYKCDIMDVEAEEIDPHRLYDLPVRQFHWRQDKGILNAEYEYDKWSIGFIAEEMDEHYPRATIYRDGKLASWSERNLIPAMLKLIQEQHEDIERLKEALNER